MAPWGRASPCTVPEESTVKVVAGFLASASAVAAIERALEEVRGSGGELHLVSFVPNPMGEESAEAYPQEQKKAQADLDAFVDGLRKQDVDAHGHLMLGRRRPADAIVEIAERVEADLIVIGMRERSRVGKLVLGSNAQEILLRAPCPVLSVKASDDDDV